MKLLIVDDEKITRDGLLNNIDWEKLGITALEQADDGLHGYEKALSFRPDILLSDIRMPRMTGIEMAEKIQQECPLLSIIFMSGYSDKAYLKAAIKLKAVSYVEKPIDLAEIEETVAEAVEQVRLHQKAVSSQALSLSFSRARLANALISSSCDIFSESAPSDIPSDFPTDTHTGFFTLVIKLYGFSLASNILEELLQPGIDKILSSFQLKEVHTARQNDLALYHIWGFHDYTNKQKEILGNLIGQYLDSLNLHYHVIIGKNVKGAAQIYDSYNSAVIELQNSFFQKENTTCVYKQSDTHGKFPALTDFDITASLSEALLRKDQQLSVNLLAKLLLGITTSENILPNQVKELYYQLLTTVNSTFAKLQIGYIKDREPEETLWGSISTCQSIYTLHSILTKRIEEFFTVMHNHAENNSTIYLIKDFIATHYAEESLSIKDISEHVFLSSSYICTLFKSETGMTLNQYLTDFRIEKAKALLIDSRNKITDISSRVGYSDGNYFGKTFKKQVGMSPSEYRERALKN